MCEPSVFPSFAFSVRHHAGTYPVFFADAVLSQIAPLISALGDYDRIFLVTDSHVGALYADTVTQALRLPAQAVYTFPAGETSKTFATVTEMLFAFQKASLTRHSLVLALGGGVCGDLCGFATAIYLRGIDYVQIPTSLLAMVDAAIGGKTGADLPFGKNLIGAFHQPRAVIADPAVLATLPEREFRSGMAEVIKTACIADESFFADICNHSLPPADLILRCMQIKARFVEEDPKEHGKRILLNFGHTFGHALESAQAYCGYTHGEAVGVGMLLAAETGIACGVTPPAVSQSIRQALVSYGLPVAIPLSADALLSYIGADKKREGSLIRLVFLTRIGEAVAYPVSLCALSGLLRANPMLRQNE